MFENIDLMYCTVLPDVLVRPTEFLYTKEVLCIRFVSFI